MYLGFVELESAVEVVTLWENASGTPTNPASAPVHRAYGPDGVMANGVGSGSAKHSGSVTGATNASPIVITSAGHGLATGMRVTVANVGGNTAANGTFQVTKVTDNTFSLDGSTGNGAYTSGGTWNVSGLYTFSVTAAAADGYEAGQTYTVLATATVGGTVMGQVASFTVV